MNPAMTTTAIKPHEGMTLAEFTASREVLRSALKRFEEAQPTCYRCMHFSMGECRQFGEVPKEFQERPEACESWVFDAIPFG